MKLKTPIRPNFSRYARLCDQTFYHDSEPVQRPIEDNPVQPKPERKTSSSFFISVSRDKRGNFRNSIYLPVGEFTHYPNHSYGKRKSPSWSFSKSEKYQNKVLVEYEVCERNPLIADDHELKMKASATSMRETMKDRVKVMHSTSYSSNKEKNSDQVVKEFKHSRNYSIISPRDTSSVGFYAQSKIKHPRYLSKQDLNKVQGALDEKHYQKKLSPCPNGYIDFAKKRARRPNSNSKGFETVLYPYQHEKQFNNFSLTQYPTVPEGHIDMKVHLDRPDHMPARLGPNTETFKIDYSRPCKSNIDLNLSTFRDKVTTRYDRMEPEPNTRLDYDAKAFALAGLLEMNRMQGRNPQLFPIVDPAIKKAGDAEMKQQLKKCIPIKEINEALRPKNIENYSLMVNGGN